MNIIVWELILVAVVAVGLGSWQLYDINRELRKHRDENTDAETSRDGTGDDGLEKTLDDERQ